LFHLLIPIEDHVQTLVNRGDTSRLEWMHFFDCHTFKVNVFRSRNRFLLHDALSFRFNQCLLSVGVGSVAACANDRALNDALVAVLARFLNFEESFRLLRNFMALLQ
jgi:hypothetical protein